MTFSVACDPGWKNCGVAVVKDEDDQISLVKAMTFDPSKCAHLFPQMIVQTLLSKLPTAPTYATIERYVSYQGVNTAESENILMLIGGLRESLQYELLGEVPEVLLVRAIDWKMDLVKLLVKHYGFDNPSSSLDKKFSIAAANHILNNEGKFENDHEADAICLAALPILKARHPGKKA